MRVYTCLGSDQARNQWLIVEAAKGVGCVPKAVTTALRLVKLYFHYAASDDEAASDACAEELVAAFAAVLEGGVYEAAVEAVESLRVARAAVEERP